ncbi:MAG: tyrosine--tRNA ligase [Deltaproteobacteria bacterium]|nr:tyrosine--tRNA ligase [Deltaproteobacteria bacterium]
MSKDSKLELASFLRGSVDLIEERELLSRIEAGEPLRVKFGMDPSSPDLHVGHAIPLLKLRDLQELGHQVVLIVGDSTAMVGDPSGKNQLRPQLTREAVEANLLTYTEQAGKILDLDRTEVRRNSEWFDQMDFEGVLKLCARMTVARMIERDTFQKRIKDSEPVGIHEFLYPLMQGWDSVQVSADVELGGTDQLFNLLVGRQLQEQEGQRPQICVTTPLINGTDGRKMSKSYGNALLFEDSPSEVFGKTMSVEDEVMEVWYTQLTRVPEEEISEILAGHPRDAKVRLAKEMVELLHGSAEADQAAEAFDRQFRSKELPDDIPEVAWPGESGLPLANLLRELGLAASGGEARRLVSQGGVRLDGEVATEPMQVVEPPQEELLIQVGKRRFARVRA